MRDGPRRLRDLTVPVTDTELLALFALIKPSWAEWPDEECLRRARSHYAGQQSWLRRVQCACGYEEFRISQAGVTMLEVLKSGIGPLQRTDLACEQCRHEILLFDSGSHGWNAVICNDQARLPPDYETRMRAVRHASSCECGHGSFRVYAGASYDYDEEELDWLPAHSLDEAYGVFAAWGRRMSWGKLRVIVDVETA